MHRLQVPLISVALAAILTSAATCNIACGTPPRVRKWTDATGKFSVTAEFVKLSDGKVHLKMTQNGGRLLTLPVERLSLPDQLAIEELTKVAALEKRRDIECRATATQWKLEHGGNDHFYEVISVPGGITWDDAQAAAAAAGGYLATITSRQENDFVFGLGDSPKFWSAPIKGSRGPWLGGFQSPATTTPHANWRWVTGETWGYTNWGSGQPNDFQNWTEDKLHFFASDRDSLWGDIRNYDSGGRPIAYVTEWDTQPQAEPSHSRNDVHADGPTTDRDTTSLAARDPSDLQAGDSVVVTSEEAPLVNDSNVAGFVHSGTILIVRDLRPSHLLVTGDGNPGWLDKRHVVRLDRAIKHFTARIEQAPADSVSHNVRGLIWNALGEYDKAIDDFTHAIQLASHADCYNNRALAYLGIHDYRKAFADFDRAIELEAMTTQQATATHLGNRGGAHYDLGKCDAALVDFREALIRDPDCLVAYVNRAATWYALGEFDKSVADCNRAIDIDEYCAIAFASRGVARNSLGHSDKAIEDLDKAIELDDTIPRWYGERATVRFGRGEYDAAKNDAGIAVKLSPQNAEAWSDLGVVCRATGDLKQSLESLTEAIRLDAQCGLPYFHRGVTYVRLDDKANAFADFQKAIRIDEAMRPQIEQFMRGLQ